MEKTVAKGIEYFKPGVVHKYQVYYIEPGGCQKSKEFNTYEEAFNAAITFANRVKGFDGIDNDKKRNVLKSTHIFDTIEDRDVTTAELTNKIQEIMNS